MSSDISLHLASNDENINSIHEMSNTNETSNANDSSFQLSDDRIYHNLNAPDSKNITFKQIWIMFLNS